MQDGHFQTEGPPQRDRQGGDILRKSSGGGHLIFFGVPFFLTGFLAVLVGIEVIPNQSEEFDLSSASAFVFGVIFMGTGLVLTFGRSGLTLDRRNNRVTQWNRLIFTLNRTVHRLDRIDGVRLYSGAGCGSETYRVELREIGTSHPITVKETPHYPQARRTAEEIAWFLGKPITDHLKKGEGS